MQRNFCQTPRATAESCCSTKQFWCVDILLRNDYMLGIMFDIPFLLTYCLNSSVQPFIDLSCVCFSYKVIIEMKQMLTKNETSNFVLNGFIYISILATQVIKY